MGWGQGGGPLDARNPYVAVSRWGGAMGSGGPWPHPRQPPPRPPTSTQNGGGRLAGEALSSPKPQRGGGAGGGGVRGPQGRASPQLGPGGALNVVVFVLVWAQSGPRSRRGLKGAGERRGKRERTPQQEGALGATALD